MRLFIYCTSLIALAQIAVAAQSAQGQMATTETPVCKFIRGTQGWSIAVSPNGERLAFLVEDRGYSVVVDGVQGKVYPRLGGYMPWFSPDSQHFAYVAGSEGHFRLILDGQESGPEFDVTQPSPIIYSPDSKHIVVLGSSGKRKNFPILDGVEQEPTDVQMDGIAFSPDSQHLAYGCGKKGKQSIVLDGVIGPQYTTVTDPKFSPDSQHLAYIATKGKKTFMVLDGKESPEGYDEIRTIDFIAPPSVTEALKKGAMAVRLMGIPVPGPTFSSDSRRLAFVARKGKKWTAVVDGNAGPEYDLIGLSGVIFSPDGNSYAYGAGKNKVQYLVANGVEKQSQGMVGLTLQYSPQGSLISAGPEGSQYFVYADGQKIAGPYSEIAASGVHLSPDGLRSMVQVVVGEKGKVMLDGKETSGYDSAEHDGMVFSPGSKHSAFVGRSGSKERMIIDGVSQMPYDRIWTGSQGFTSDDKISYIALSAATLSFIRVETRLSDAAGSGS